MPESAASFAPPPSPLGAHGHARAFTLLELLMVMTLIAILATITMVLGRGIGERSKIAQARAELAVLAAALEQYKQHYGDYPWVQETAEQAYTYYFNEDRWSWINEDRLYRALSGRMGPKGAEIDPPGRSFIEESRFTIASVGGKSWFVDPFGRGYSYYYRVQQSDPNSLDPLWKNPGFVLYSHGPDMECEPTPNTAGVISRTGANADNIFYGDD